jgi:hypothetical protein
MKTISPQELQQLNQLLSHVMGQSGKTPQDVDDKITGKSNTKNEQRKQSIQSDNGQTSPS